MICKKITIKPLQIFAPGLLSTNRKYAEEKENLNFVGKTNRLVDLVTDNVSKENEVELYCCWVGDYESNLENVDTIKILDKDFRHKFEIEEKKLMRFA